MTPKELQARTKQFAADVIALVRELPASIDARRLGEQLLDCGTSVAANYRASCRARSRAEFIAKMGIVEEEVDESVFWLELMIDAHIVTEQRVARLMKEANELTAITVASIKTARNNR